MLSVRGLRVLVELERRGTLAEAARALNYTPSAVSQQLAALEREAGVALLTPVGRGVRLTDAGRMLAGHAHEIIGAIARAETDLANLSYTVSGQVRVASFQSVLLEVAPRALALLADEHPDLDVVLFQRDVDDAHSGLLSHAFDLILGEEFDGHPQPPVPGVQREDLLTDPLWVALPSALAAQRAPRRLADLADQPWALESSKTRMGRWARTECFAAGFNPRIRSESTDPTLHMQLVASGLAVSFVPALFGARLGRGIDVFALAGADGAAPRRTLYTEVRDGQARHLAIRAVRSAFVAAAGGIPVHRTNGTIRTGMMDA